MHFYFFTQMVSFIVSSILKQQSISMIKLFVGDLRCSNILVMTFILFWNQTIITQLMTLTVDTWLEYEDSR